MGSPDKRYEWHLPTRMASTVRLASMLAHELNNPLAALTNILYLLAQSRNLNDKDRILLEATHSELARLQRVVNTLLALYGETLPPTCVNVYELMDSALKLYSERVKEKGIQMDKRYRGGGHVHGYEAELRQLLSNLMARAIRDAPRGSTVKLHVYSCVSCSSPGTRGIRIVVASEWTAAEKGPMLLDNSLTGDDQFGALEIWVSKEIIQKHAGVLRLRRSTTCQNRMTVSLFLPENGLEYPDALTGCLRGAGDKTNEPRPF
jgi:nitrogen-specific signal transduction histidine kinase